jgi:hypothetical protein
MIKIPAPFDWLDLKLLYKTPERFPNPDVSGLYPLFPHYAATAILILLSKKSIAQINTMGENQPLKNNLQYQTLLMQSPTMLFEILKDGNKFDSWLKEVRISLSSRDSDNFHFPEQVNEKVPNGLKKRVFLNCYGLCVTNRRGNSKTFIENLTPAFCKYGIQPHHLIALATLEHLDLLVRGRTNNFKDFARQQYNACAFTLRFFYSKQFKIDHDVFIQSLFYKPDDIDQAEDNDGHNSKRVRHVSENLSITNEIKRHREPWLNREQRLKIRNQHNQTWQNLGEGLEKTEFASGMYKGLSTYRKKFERLSGALKNKEKSDQFWMYVMSLALPIMTEVATTPWSTPYQASKQILAELNQKLKIQPFVNATPDKKSGEYKKKNSVTAKTLEAIFSNYSSDYPQFFESKVEDAIDKIINI